MKQIYEIDNDEPQFNHKNVISNEVKHFVESSMNAERNVKISGADHTLKYCDTLYYLVGGETLHRYFVNGNNEKTVLIDKDGKIQSILYDYAVLDITKTTSPNLILELLKSELGKNFDISRYEYVHIPEQAQESAEYWIYEYRFFNEENGYITEYLRAAVSDDGSVFGVRVHNLDTRELNLNIDKKKEQHILELKLQEIYNTDFSQYKSYDMKSDPLVITYNGQLCIQYCVGVKYVDMRGEEQAETSSFLNNILNPIELIRS